VALSRDYRELFLGNQVKLLISTCMVHGRLEFLAPSPGTTLGKKESPAPVGESRGLSRGRELALRRFETEFDEWPRRINLEGGRSGPCVNRRVAIDRARSSLFLPAFLANRA